MLEFLRKKAQSRYLQAAVLVIILVFIFWGTNAGNSGRADNVATVNGQGITVRAYQQNYERLANQYREQFGGQIPPQLLEALDLKGQTLQQLIEQELIHQGALEMGLAVSDEEVRRNIQDMAAFRKGSSFDLDRYKQVLSASRMSISDFETDLRSDLLRQKVLSQLGDFARVSPQELKERFVYDYGEVNLHYATVTPDRFTEKVEVTEEGLAAYFEENKDRYRTEPLVKVKYVSFPFAAEAGEVEEAAIEANRAMQKASQAYEQIILSGSLEKYAAQQGIAIKETDFFSRQTPPAELAENQAFLEAAFSLKAGELSSLLTGEKGYAILFVQETKEPEVPPLAQVRERVKKDFVAARAEALAKEAAQKLLADIKGGAELAAKAGELGLEVKDTGFLSRHQPPPEGLPAKMLQEGLALSGARPYPEEVVAEGGRYYVLRFKEHRAPSEELFAGKKKELEQRLEQQEQMALLAGWIEKLKSEAEITQNEELLR